MRKKLIIHPEDPSTEFLKSLYLNEVALTGNFGNAHLRRQLQNSDEIWLLGHGCGEFGLLDMKSRFGVLNIVGSQHVQFLRDKLVVGVFCNANMFAERYGLTGLFTGMIISEMQESIDWNVSATIDEILDENMHFANNLNYCIEECKSLKEVPGMMRGFIKENSSPLVRFNYESVFWIENGETIEDESITPII